MKWIQTVVQFKSLNWIAFLLEIGNQQNFNHEFNIIFTISSQKLKFKGFNLINNCFFFLINMPIEIYDVGRTGRRTNKRSTLK